MTWPAATRGAASASCRSCTAVAAAGSRPPLCCTGSCPTRRWATRCWTSPRGRPWPGRRRSSPSGTGGPLARGRLALLGVERPGGPASVGRPRVARRRGGGGRRHRTNRRRPGPLAGRGARGRGPFVATSLRTEPDVEAVRLGDADMLEMLDLVARTQPGPFLPRTHLLGTYLGIRRGGRLVATAGERFRPPGWVEVADTRTTAASTENCAVSTSPACSAARLITVPNVSPVLIRSQAPAREAFMPTIRRATAEASAFGATLASRSTAALPPPPRRRGRRSETPTSRPGRRRTARGSPARSRSARALTPDPYRRTPQAAEHHQEDRAEGSPTGLTRPLSFRNESVYRS